VRCVIAHELAHALLIQRGYLNWVFGGVGRVVVVARMLEYITGSFEADGSRFYTGRVLKWGAERMAMLCVRCAATYLRQDEFDADAAAARLCGAAIYARSLTRVQLAADTPPLPWRERVVQSQRAGSYCAWLRGRFNSNVAPDPGLLLGIVTHSVRDPMSTHPALPDRLAALPDAGPAFPQAFTVSAAEEYLRDPEETARKLIDRLEETAADEQRAENRDLLRGVLTSHATSRRLRWRKLGWWLLSGGVVLLLLGPLPLVHWWQNTPDVLWGVGITNACLLGLGALLLATTRVRETEPLAFPRILDVDDRIAHGQDRANYRPLPVASLPVWPATTAARGFCVFCALIGLTGIAGSVASMATSGRSDFVVGPMAVSIFILGAAVIWACCRFRVVKRPWVRAATDQGRLVELMEELRPLGETSGGGASAGAVWRQEAEAALVASDFLRAVAAARLCLGELPGDRHARMVQAIASAYFSDRPGSDRLLEPLVSAEGLGPSLSCTLGWTRGLSGEWQPAEGYFLDALRYQPKEPSFWKFLAYAQWRRGKSLEAARSARKALSLAGANADDERALLARILMDLGRPLHALEEVDQLAAEAQGHWQIQVVRLRALLLLERFAEAEQLSAELDGVEVTASAHLEIASAFLEADQEAAAEQRAARAAVAGFNPEAHLLRARIAARRKDQGQVFEQVRQALDLQRPPAPGACGPLLVLEDALELLRTFEPPVMGCLAWGYVLDTGIGMPRQYVRLVACDLDWERANGRVRWLCQLLFPQRDPVTVARCITPVADPIRPDGLHAPGLYDPTIYQ
jgi:Flp pilus assembly protein TadD